MLAKAKDYKANNKAKTGDIGAKNNLEFYIYLSKNTLLDSKVDKKLDTKDKVRLKAKINKTIT